MLRIAASVCAISIKCTAAMTPYVWVLGLMVGQNSPSISPNCTSIMQAAPADAEQAAVKQGLLSVRACAAAIWPQSSTSLFGSRVAPPPHFSRCLSMGLGGSATLLVSDAAFDTTISFEAHTRCPGQEHTRHQQRHASRICIRNTRAGRPNLNPQNASTRRQ